MIRFGLVLLVSGTALLSGCGGKKDFTPAAGMPGETIFQQACHNCHDTPKDLKLAIEDATPKAIKEKVGNGSLMMPSFPNIKGAELDALAEYVAKNASRK